MSLAREDIMGEGASSICRRGTNIATGEVVAIKVYKSAKPSPGRPTKYIEDVKLQKFIRQISVLKQLMEPFTDPSETGGDLTFWHKELANVRPDWLFMQLVDYSK